MSFPKETLALISERRFNSICTRGDIKLLVIEKSFIQRSSMKIAYLVAPLGRVVGGISKNYDPYIYSKYKISDNVEFLVNDVNPRESIEHIIDMCKLFTDNHDIQEEAKKLVRLRLAYRVHMISFLKKIKDEMKNKRKLNEVKYIEKQSGVNRNE